MSSTLNAYIEIAKARRHFVYSFCSSLCDWTFGKQGQAAFSYRRFWGPVCLNIWRKKTFAHERVQWKWEDVCPAEIPSVRYQVSEAIDKS